MNRTRIVYILLAATVVIVVGSFWAWSQSRKGVSIQERVAVSVDSSKLPPDPGEGGKQTLAGIDSDKDGVRDDVQRWIVMSYPSSADELLRKALGDFAVSMQAMIINSNASQSVLSDIAKQRTKTQYCINYIQDTKLNDSKLAASETYDLIKALKATVLNTRERSKAFLIADSKQSGSSGTMVDRSLWKEMCN